MTRRSRFARLTAALLTFAFALNASAATVANCRAMSPGESTADHAVMMQSEHHARHSGAIDQVLSSTDRSAQMGACHQALMCWNAAATLDVGPLLVAGVPADAPVPNRANAPQLRSIHPEPPPPKA